MPLSLGVSVGDKIAVGDSVIEVRATALPQRIIISVNGGKEITVDDNEAHPVEILPDVQVFVGIGPGKHSTANRLAFKAPREFLFTECQRKMLRRKLLSALPSLRYLP